MTINVSNKINVASVNQERIKRDDRLVYRSFRERHFRLGFVITRPVINQRLCGPISVLILLVETLNNRNDMAVCSHFMVGS